MFTITSFATNAAGQLVANGTYTGSYTDPVTGAVQQIISTASSVVDPPRQAAARCSTRRSGR